ncbi:helix-turn-helix transcriptional regulator [Francisellaceae bacterium]|nr:helix-turn-helix transcriptional regulator [Francisellaceae bacterium]
MKLDITYSYSEKLDELLGNEDILDIKYIETYHIDQTNHQIKSTFSSKAHALEYLANNKPNDDFRLHKFITKDSMFQDILPELDDPLSSHNLLLTNHILSVKNILYFYFPSKNNILIISFAVRQNNLFVAQKYLQYINFANNIESHFINDIDLTATFIAQYSLNNIKPNYLSVKQKSILKYIVSGLMNKEISKITDLSTRTVEKHVSNICKILNVKNRNQLISQYSFYADKREIYDFSKATACASVAKVNKQASYKLNNT